MIIKCIFKFKSNIFLLIKSRTDWLFLFDEYVSRFHAYEENKNLSYCENL